jgi:hypothetical protein
MRSAVDRPGRQIVRAPSGAIRTSGRRRTPVRRWFSLPSTMPHDAALIRHGPSWLAASTKRHVRRNQGQRWVVCCFGSIQVTGTGAPRSPGRAGARPGRRGRTRYAVLAQEAATIGRREDDRPPQRLCRFRMREELTERPSGDQNGNRRSVPSGVASPEGATDQVRCRRRRARPSGSTTGGFVAGQVKGRLPEE